MATYPRLNWWPGNLRPYESASSFIARFGELNGISGKECRAFLAGFGVDTRDVAFPRLAEMLNEPSSVVTTVFGPLISLADCAEYRLPPLQNSQSLRYCPVCATSGYHSYLHEIPWLAKCPFHGAALKEHFLAVRMNAADTRSSEAFRSLMMEASTQWPRALDESATIHERGCLGLLSDWCSRATVASKAMSVGQIWRAGAEHCTDLSIGEAIGLLRSLAPMPEQIQPLFVDVGHLWRVETRHFPAESRQALVTISPPLLVQTFLDYYKHCTVRTRTVTTFMILATCWKEELKQRHGECHCCWGRTGTGWNQTWIQVHEDEWPQWNLLCPYQIAIEELDRCSGDVFVGLNRSQRDRAESQDIGASTYMYELGMVKWPEDAGIPSNEIKFFPQNLVHLVWQGSSVLNSLLEALAEQEIEQLGAALTVWLDAISLGSHPAAKREITKSVRLRESEKGLSLVTWIKLKSDAKRD